MISLPTDFLKLNKRIPFGVYDAFGRLLMASGTTLTDEDRLEALQRRELYVDEKEAGPWRNSFTQTAQSLIHRGEATLEMIAAARVDKNRRGPPGPRR
ncbi:MAG: hypothetical protein ABI574_05170 [Burkholderiales bacterium]